jgi:hypothetical protein
MACNKSLIVVVACCTPQIILRAGLLPNTNYYWTIKSERTNNLYQKLVTSNSSGDVIIDMDDLPDGLIHQYAGLFELKIKEGTNYLNTVKMLLLGVEEASIYFHCINVSNPVTLNSTISTEAILNNPNNTTGSTYTQIVLPIASYDQTNFVIPQILQNANDTFLFVNGVERNIGVHYNVIGTILTWISTNYALETSDELVFYYK